LLRVAPRYFDLDNLGLLFADRLPMDKMLRELLQFAADRLGWSLRDFDLYRLRLEYPLHHTTLQFKFTFPEGVTGNDR
jgi:hypothetical protein